MPLLNLSISQLLWLFVAANILKKLRPNILFLRWLASRGLTCYKVPEDADLRKLLYKESGCVKKGPSKSSKKSKHIDAKLRETNKFEFKIKSADLVNLELKRVKIWPWALENTLYGEELEWVVDFACISLISFAFLELIFYYSPKSGEYNFSLLWVLLVIIQCLYTLLHLTSLYFKYEVSLGERSICIASGLVFLLIAMLIMTLDGGRLELGVDKAIHSWNYKLVKGPSQNYSLDAGKIGAPTPKLEVGSDRSTHTIVIKLLVAVICSLVGVTFTFPGLRFGQLHELKMGAPDTSSMEKILYNFNYLSPALVICLWIPAISRDLVRRQNLIEINDDKFELIRISILISANVFRFILVRNYTETFLNSVGDRITRLRCRGGTTTNKVVQMTIAGMNNYVNIVCMQYILPALICLYTAIMYSSLNRNEPLKLAVELRENSSLTSLFGNQTFMLTAEQILTTSRGLLASDMPKNVSSFATWWLHFAWLCTSTAGVVYHKYFPH